MDIKERFPLWNGSRLPKTMEMAGQNSRVSKFPRNQKDLEDWAPILIEWSEDPRNIRLPTFAAQMRFPWQRMYEWKEFDKEGVWQAALDIALENVGRNRESSVGQEGGIHQAVFNKTAHVFDAFSYSHHVKDRKEQIKETSEAAGQGGAIIKVIVPDLCGDV